MIWFNRWFSRLVSWRHPDIGALLLWAEGGVDPRIGAHLSCCAGCREHALLLRESMLALHIDAATAAVLDDVFEHLQLRIRAVRDGHCQVNAAVEHYFGKPAVRKLANEAGLISNAKPLFNAFLGRKAADALTSHLASAA